jgi:D-alanyl-D-alanine-carboxypeptidase/D-alanyl-D-alanine-endopeptidase
MRTNHLFGSLGSFGFIVYVVFSGVAAEPEPALTDAALQKILQERIDAKKAVGLVVGRLQGTNRSIVTAGTMALGSGQPVDGDTVFEIGSITKIFTGILLGDMANRGELQANDPVTNYLPATVKVPNRNGHVITLAHLANHHSGLPREPDNLAPADKKNPYADYTPELLFRFLSTYELPRDPGSTYEYSNVGMGLLGDVLARRASTSYEQLVLDLICKPLGMGDTRIKLSAEMQNRFATGYDYDLNPAKNMDFLSLAGGGAFRSTANDFLKFLAISLDPQDDRLSKAIRASQAARTNTVGLNEEVAWGWHFKCVPDEILHHSGKTFGFHSFMGINRKRHRAVVVFSNCQFSIDDIGLHVLDPRSELIPAQKPIVLDEITLGRYVGTYTVTPTLEITVTREKNEMYIQATDQPKHDIFALARDQFFCETGPLRLTFKTNVSGMVTEVILRQAGQEYRAHRK